LLTLDAWENAANNTFQKFILVERQTIQTWTNCWIINWNGKQLLVTVVALWW